MSSFDHREYERTMANVLCAADPQAELERYTNAETTSPELRALLANVEARGLRIASLLIARLRFERVMQGSRTATAEFERDPRAFTERFRAYHHEVPPTAFSPLEEAAQFEEWR